MGVHDDGEVVKREVGDPERAVIALHGRGASAAAFARTVAEVAEDALILAPQAHQRTWYPESFLAPREQNQPWLDAALDRVGQLLAQAADQGYDADRTHLIGFSQGACLATEFAAARPRRFGSVSGLSGGLIGEEVVEDRYTGSLDDTPVFLGCSDTDPHIPVERVHATAEILSTLGADVDERIYPGMGHTINEDEQRCLADLLS